MNNREKWDRRFMAVADLVASWSKDPSTKHGAVIVDPLGRIVSVGFNGFPKGVEDSDERMNNREVKYRIVMHCEENAVLFAGGRARGATCYTTGSNCAHCAAILAQAGIKRTVYSVSNKPDFEKRWLDDCNLGRQILLEAGVEVSIYDQSVLTAIIEHQKISDV